MEVTIEPWMAELDLRFSPESRKAAWDVPGHQIRNPNYLSDLGSLNLIPGMPVEDVRVTVDRIKRDSDRFLSSLGYVRNGGFYEVEQANDLQIAVFAHGGFGLTWLSILLEIPTPLMWSGFFLHTSSVTQILFDERPGGFATPRCLMISALPHLFASSQIPGKAGIQSNYT